MTAPMLRRSIIAASRLRAAPAVTDPFWSQVVLLMPMDSNFSDVKGHVPTVTGATISTTTPKFGTGSGQFSATGDRVSFPYSTDFDLLGDFTIEFHIWLSAAPTAGGCILSNGWISAGGSTYAPYLLYNRPSSPGVLFFSSSNGTSWNVSNGIGGKVLTLNAWTHVAVVRSGNTYSIFYDGARYAQATSAGVFNPTNKPITIGSDGASGALSPMRIDNIRITKAARYTTASFTPPDTAYPTS